MSSDNIIELNIGGTVFELDKSKLTKSDKFFKTILETDVPVIKDEFGRIFIDRSPKHFDMILKFMSDDDVAIPDSQKDVLEIRKEAQYYQLNGLVHLCIYKIKSYKQKISIDLQKSIAKSRREWYKGIKKFDYLMTDQQNYVVKLNVGGTVFQTTKTTLMKFNGFFRTMLEPHIPLAQNESGCIVIDRNSKHFETILNYMRDGYVTLPLSYDKDVQEYIQEIQQDAEYYMLDGLIELCKERIPIDLPTELKNNKTEKELAELIQNVKNRPVFIVNFAVDSNGRAFPPDIVKFSKVAEENKASIDFYFKPTQFLETDISRELDNYQIIVLGRVKYEGNFESVSCGIRKCEYFKDFGDDTYDEDEDWYPREYDSDNEFDFYDFD